MDDENEKEQEIEGDSEEARETKLTALKAQALSKICSSIVLPATPAVQFENTKKQALFSFFSRFRKFTSSLFPMMFSSFL